MTCATCFYCSCFPSNRWLYNRRPSIPMEVRRPGSGDEGPASPSLHTPAIQDWHLYQQDQYRGVFLPQGRPTLQKGVLLLPHSDLHSLLYARYRLMGIFLVGSQCYSRKSVSRRHDPSHDGNTDQWDQCISSPSLLHQGYWCVDGVMSDFCLRCSLGVCFGQLRLKEWRSSHECREALTGTPGSGCNTSSTAATA